MHNFIHVIGQKSQINLLPKVKAPPPKVIESKIKKERQI